MSATPFLPCPSLHCVLSQVQQTSYEPAWSWSPSNNNNNCHNMIHIFLNTSNKLTITAWLYEIPHVPLLLMTSQWLQRWFWSHMKLYKWTIKFFFFSRDNIFYKWSCEKSPCFSKDLNGIGVWWKCMHWLLSASQQPADTWKCWSEQDMKSLYLK